MTVPSSTLHHMLALAVLRVNLNLLVWFAFFRVKLFYSSIMQFCFALTWLPDVSTEYGGEPAPWQHGTCES